MTITITFQSMPGDVQIESITFRVNGDDHAGAVARATETAKQFTAIPIASIYVQVTPQ